jgi:hypothetical protein
MSMVGSMPRKISWAACATCAPVHRVRTKVMRFSILLPWEKRHLAGYLWAKVLIPRVLESCYTARSVCGIWQLLHASLKD